MINVWVSERNHFSTLGPGGQFCALKVAGQFVYYRIRARWAIKLNGKVLVHRLRREIMILGHRLRLPPVNRLDGMICRLFGHWMFFDTGDVFGPSTCKICKHKEPGSTFAWPPAPAIKQSKER